MLARGEADFSRGCEGVRGLACPPSPGIAPPPYGGQSPYQGQSPPTQHQGQTWPSRGSRRAPSPPPAAQQTSKLLKERQITFTSARGSPGSAPSQVGGGPGHRGQQGRRTLEPLGWRLRLCGPSSVPRVGPNKPCVVCRESLPPGPAFCSAGFVSRSEVLEPFRPSWSQAVSHARRQKDTPPPEHGGAGAAKAPKSQRSQILGGEEVAWGL